MIKNLMKITLLALLLSPTFGQSAERKIPQFPPPEEKLRVIIDTDAACEIDDLYAIALALLSTDRFEIEGFIGAHFGDAGGPEGVTRSIEAITTVMEKAGLPGKFPVKRGANPFQYSQVPVESEGVDFIIDRAMNGDPSRPLYVILLGPATDIASAYLKCPEIKDHVIVFWHGRTQWPVKCWNFNAYNDLKAVRILFTSDLPLILFDTGTYLRCPMDKSKEIIYPYSELGKFLHEFRYNKEWYQSPSKGFYDLGDIAALVNPSLVYHEIVHAPEVKWDMNYIHNKKHGKMVRIYQIDRDETFGVLNDRLKH